jgi:hypothetical protein
VNVLARTVPRPRTRGRTVTVGGVKRKVPAPPVRVCNGCRRALGDSTRQEVKAEAAGEALPDVRGECPTCTRAAPGRLWVLHLPFDKPLSLNDRPGRDVMAGAAVKRQWRQAVAALARAERIPPLHRMAVEVHAAPVRAGLMVRDPLNLAATLKVCEDALVDVNVVPDDSVRWCQSPMPTIDPPTSGRANRLYLIVRELT